MIRLAFFSSIITIFFFPIKGKTQFTLPKQKSIQVTSPNGQVIVELTTKKKVLYYTVRYVKTTVIEPSPLGVVVNGFTYGTEALIGKVVVEKNKETYAYRGVHSRAVNNYNGARVSVNGNGRPFIVEARAFNDGVAFRYIINQKDSSLVDKDITQFTLPAGSSVWSQPNIKYYEGRYTKKLIDTIANGSTMGPPVTFRLPGNDVYAAITEGGLTDFAGMSLVSNGNRVLQANLSGTTKGNGRIQTPWRIIEIGRDLNTLVNCDIIANVSAAYNKKLFPEGYQTAWVKPGRSVWSWLAKTRSVTLDNMKHFSDLAAQLGFEYNLVDEGWGNWKDSLHKLDHWAMMKELVDYSAAKGVKIWVWKAYPNRGGIAGIKDAAQRINFFKRCKEIGIAGLKIDFFDAESQEIINFYQDALKDAAMYQLMINFHGANKPTGEARTWPNEMTREAVRGMENQPPWAASNTTLPFTRYLAGHADYTPVHFGSRQGEVSWAHHVASMIVFTSPFLCVGADPQSILDNPCKGLIQSIPAVWDETVVLPQSKIGELVVYARRKGSTWFIAAMNGEHQAKEITIKLNFLPQGRHQLLAVKDDKQKQAGVIMNSEEVVATSTITIELNPEGGFAARIDK